MWIAVTVHCFKKNNGMKIVLCVQPRCCFSSSVLNCWCIDYTNLNETHKDMPLFLSTCCFHLFFYRNRYVIILILSLSLSNYLKFRFPCLSLLILLTGTLWKFGVIKFVIAWVFLHLFWWLAESLTFTH